MPDMSSPWLDLKVFYVRVSNYEADKSTPQNLTLNHIPLAPDTILEVNGKRSTIHSDCFTSFVRRDRMDKRSEEATFVSTDSIRTTGSVRFEVYDKDDLLLSGVLELSNDDGFIRKWGMKCQMGTSPFFLKRKQNLGVEMALPSIEVYVAGCFSGSPIILTKTLKLGVGKKKQTKVTMDSVAEYELNEWKRELLSKDTLQLSEYHDYKPEHDMDVDYNSIYSRAKYMEGVDGELSWFNAGVRVGVGLGLGICLGIGVGVGLLVRTYQATTTNFRKRLH